MNLNVRQPSLLLKRYRTLSKRNGLTPEEQEHFSHIEKGYQGEVAFDDYMSKYPEDSYLAVNDILINYNDTLCQFDSVLLIGSKVLVINVKNSEGNYIIKGDNWYILPSNKEVKNPLLQLTRSATLMRRYLQDHRHNFIVEPQLVFIQPSFTLYQAPEKLPALFYGQLDRFFNTLFSNSTSFTDKQLRLAKQLLKDNLPDTFFKKELTYTFEKLTKGVHCSKCGGWMLKPVSTIVCCSVCHSKESVSLALERSAEEYRLLFPESQLTTEKMYIWCNGLISKKAIRRNLKKIYLSKGDKRNRYYEKK